jgi:hypothetical protein
MDRDTFVCDENWFGSYYELAIELGPTGDDERLRKALEHVWSLPQLRGSWIERHDYDLHSSPIECRDGIVPSRYGVLRLTPEISVGCVTHTVREPNGSDWLDLCIPTGMLGLCFDVQYPLDYATNPWMAQIDRLLAQMAASVFRSISFQLAIIGEEVSGITDAASITPDDCRFCPFLLPELLWQRLGLSTSRQVLTHGLTAIGLGDS